MIRKHGSAVWTGGLKDGKGTVSTESGVLDEQPYGFNTRFQDGAGTNPEELIGAAHASCFAMALSNILGEKDVVPDRIEAKSTVTMDADKLEVVAAHLDVTISAEDANNTVLIEAADAAKAGCRFRSC